MEDARQRHKEIPQVHIFGRLLPKASTLPVVVWKLDRFKKWDRSRESHYVLTGSRQELWRCMGFFLQVLLNLVGACNI
jgi:hypothetical protein